MSHFGSFFQAAALWAAASFLWGCAATKSQGEIHPNDVSSLPPECVMGDSGPTLNPGDAYRKARENALFALAEARLGVHIVSEYRETSSGYIQLRTEQTLRGLVREAKIVSVWSSTNDSRCEIVHAVACPAESSVQNTASKNVPLWLFDFPTAGNEICTLGMAGPTLDPNDQDEQARRDAILNLSQSLEMTVNERLIDNGRTVVTVQRSHTVSPQTEAYVQEKVEIRENWSDEDGKGPLGRRGMIYVLACVPLG